MVGAVPVGAGGGEGVVELALQPVGPPVGGCGVLFQVA